MKKYVVFIISVLCVAGEVISQDYLKPLEKSNYYVSSTLTVGTRDWGAFSLNDIKKFESQSEVFQSDIILPFDADKKTVGYFNQFTDFNVGLLFQPKSRPSFIFRGQFTISENYLQLYSDFKQKYVPSDTILLGNKVAFIDTSISENIDYYIIFKKVGIGFSALKIIKQINSFQFYTGIALNGGMYLNSKSYINYYKEVSIEPSINSNTVISERLTLGQNGRKLKNGYYSSLSIPIGFRILPNSKHEIINRLQLNLEFNPCLTYEKMSSLGVSSIYTSVFSLVGVNLKIN